MKVNHCSISTGLTLGLSYFAFFPYLGPYPSMDLFRKIDTFIGPQLTTLASVVGEQSAKKQQRYQVVKEFPQVDS